MKKHRNSLSAFFPHTFSHILGLFPPRFHAHTTHKQLQPRELRVSLTQSRTQPKSYQSRLKTSSTFLGRNLMEKVCCSCSASGLGDCAIRLLVPPLYIFGREDCMYYNVHAYMHTFRFYGQSLKCSCFSSGDEARWMCPRFAWWRLKMGLGRSLMGKKMSSQYGTQRHPSMFVAV